MKFKETIRLSLEAILANRFRALLTMLGVIIGVASVVLLVSVGNGAKNYILTQFEGLGTNIIVVQPGRSNRKSSFGPPMGASQRKMTLADVQSLEVRSTTLDSITGLVYGSVTAKFEESTASASVFGSNENFAKIINLKIQTGDFFSREEDDYGRRVVVLGNKVARTLFGDDTPLGKSVKLNQSEYRVIGVAVKSGDKLGFNVDDFVFIPTHAALRLFNEDKLFGIRARAKSRSSVDDAVEEISDILRERRNGEEDFTIITQVAMIESLSTILNMLTYVLGGIAAISMLVGGIGIMNIMLVSVSERTHEVGIRRAVGARRRDILQQFLAEAVTLSALGGLTGLFISLVITHGVSFAFPSFDMRPPWWILLPAFGISLLIGVIFGVWPARKAAQIETLDALRYE